MVVRMNPTYAIIATGGKQCLAQVGETVKIEKLAVSVGEKVEITDVLLVGDEEQAIVGKPLVAGAVVVAEALTQGRAKKVTGVRFKPKKRQKTAFGHRQLFTEILIKEIKLA